MRFWIFVAAFLIGGCTSVQPVKGTRGESIVFVKEVKWAGGVPAGTGSIGGAVVSRPLAGGANPIAAGAVAAVAGGVLQAIKGPQIIVAIFDHDPRAENAPTLLIGHNKTLQRKPWPGVELLQPMTWAMLAVDDNGEEIVVPCPVECSPVD